LQYDIKRIKSESANLCFSDFVYCFNVNVGAI
jgi:hypothetical protein